MHYSRILNALVYPFETQNLRFQEAVLTCRAVGLKREVSLHPVLVACRVRLLIEVLRRDGLALFVPRAGFPLWLAFVVGGNRALHAVGMSPEPIAFLLSMIVGAAGG